VAGASIELLDLPGIAGTSDANGLYSLFNVPYGEHFLFARMPYGTSDLLPVILSSQDKVVDIEISTASPLAPVVLVQGNVNDESGAPVGEATVWVLGRLTLTSSEPDGSFQLVVPPVNTLVGRRKVYLAASQQRWGFTIEPDEGPPTIVLDRALPAPASPLLVYDFVAHAPEASWRNGSTDLAWNLPDNDARGFALWRSDYLMEDGTSPSLALETHPQWVPGGTISGLYPEIFTPKPGDLFVARVGFIEGAAQGSVQFSVTFSQLARQFRILWSVVPATSHDYGTTLIPLLGFFPSEAHGRPGQIILSVDAVKSSAQDWAVWVEALLIREQ